MSLDFNIKRVRSSGYRQQPKFLIQLVTIPKEPKCFKSPQINDKLQDVNSDVHHSAPHHTSVLIIPFLKLFRWSLLVPDVIKFDKNKVEFFCQKGSFLLRTLSHVWLLLMSIYLSLICFNDMNEHYTVKALVAKMTWVCYTLFDVAVIKCLRMNGDKIAKLLTEGSKISWLCERIGTSTNGLNMNTAIKKKMSFHKHVIVLTCLISVIYTATFVVYVITELTAITTNLYTIFMDVTSSLEVDDGKSKWNCQTVRCNLLERYVSNGLASTLLTFWLLMAFGVEIIWVIFLTMTTSFGYYFTKLLGSCIQVIKSDQLDITEGIRIFTKITLLLEDFNKIFGSTMLWIMIASVMYTAATLGEFLAGITNGFVYDMLNVIGFLPFIGALYTGSELHRTGQILPSIIKQQYFHLRATNQNQMYEVIQGTNIVQYDVLSNNIGMKGHGFFTISYTLVTSLVGVIITYSLVAVQFKLGEIPLNSNINTSNDSYY